MGRFRRAPLSAALVITAFVACTSDTAPASTIPAIVTIAFAGYPADTMRVVVSNEAAIAAASSYVATHRGPHLVAGTIVRGSGIDSRYPFQFVPESVEFLDAAIERCDGAPMRTDVAVNSFFAAALGNSHAPAATWCPWSSYPILVERQLTQ
jgi:hypothetical protein